MTLNTDHPDYYLRQLLNYQKEIEGIKTELDKLENVPDQLKNRVKNLYQRIQTEIRSRQKREPKSAPPLTGDF
jgi:prefoldin subunit 5